MANYEVQVDITMSGSLCVESSSEQEAKEKVRKILENFGPPDFMTHCCIFKEFVDVWKL